MIAAKQKVGNVVLALHMRRTLMSDALAPNFTLAVMDEAEPQVIELKYLGQNGGHAQRRYEVFLENARALQAFEALDGREISRWR